MTPSCIFLAGCLGFLLGAFIASGSDLIFDERSATFPTAWVLVGGGGLVALLKYPFGAPFGSRKYLPVLAGVALLGVGLGVFRVGGAITDVASQPIRMREGERVTLVGRVVRHPDRDLDRLRFVLDAKDPVRGRVLVSAERHAEVSLGDTVSVSGAIQLPEAFATETGGTFDYPKYLAKDGISATLRTDRVAVVSRIAPTHPFWLLGRSRGAIDAAAAEALPQQEGALLRAMVTGDEGAMTEPFKEALNRSGLRHLVAVSGMNIVILLSIIGAVANRSGASHRSAFWWGVGLVAFFVLLIGAPASAVRAGIMGVLLAAASLLQRPKSGLRAAVAAGAVMAAFSPLMLRYDVGFQLSFLALLGIVLFSPWISRVFRRLPPILSETLTMTFAAQAAVLPLLLSSFGQVSLVAPLSNLLVVPAMEIVMPWSIAAAIAGVTWLPFGQLVALPLLPFYAFVIWIAETFGALPVAQAVLGTGAAQLFAALWYALLGRITHRTRKRTLLPIERVALYEK